MRGVEVRALAYAAPFSRNDETLDEYAEKISANLRDAAKLLESAFGRVRTLRIVFPYVDSLAETLDVRPEKVVETLYDAVSSSYNYLAFPLKDVGNLYLIRYILENFEKAFTSVPYNVDMSGNIAQMLTEVSSNLGYIAAARLAVSFGQQLLTPYFPATTGGKEAVMMSLLYPKYLEDAIQSGAELSATLEALAQFSFKALKRAVNSAELGVDALLIDYSLSPWLEASSARVVEAVSGAKLGEPGTLGAIYEINKAIQRAAEKYFGGGFNEVMLPVAEDDRLKELVAEGALKLRDIVSMVSTCVAGLDMVLLPADFSVEELSRLMMDLYALHKVKNRVIGMRVILTDMPPGFEAELGMFGRVPVAEI
ncbi:MAG: hypothetical protein DRJ55_01215 [Thermoprotei archaeon]|nr:MAG: hypothetical protein DRJ55_01215 [Thermoprotei archaeon]